jgi:hypothetical protein
MSGHRPHQLASTRRVTTATPAAPTAQERPLRASDREREAVVEALRHHAAAGRLDGEELADRVEVALAARHRGTLADVLADLPRDDAPVPATTPARPVAARPGPALVPAVLLVVAIAAAVVLTGSGWPLWFLFGLMPLLQGGSCAPAGRARHPA